MPSSPARPAAAATADRPSGTPQPGAFPEPGPAPVGPAVRVPEQTPVATPPAPAPAPPGPAAEPRGKAG
jgi:hypothetical protein